jgi:hypothetical protein
LWIRSRHTRVLINRQRHPTAKVAHSSRSADPQCEARRIAANIAKLPGFLKRPQY